MGKAARLNNQIGKSFFVYYSREKNAFLGNIRIDGMSFDNKILKRSKKAGFVQLIWRNLRGAMKIKPDTDLLPVAVTNYYSLDLIECTVKDGQTTFKRNGKLIHLVIDETFTHEAIITNDLFT